MRLSEKAELEDFEERWYDYGAADFRKQLIKELGLPERAEFCLEYIKNDRLQAVFLDTGGDYFFDGNGVCIKFNRVSWECAANELLGDYIKDLVEDLRYKAWIGEIDRFSPIMHAFWDDGTPYIAELETFVDQLK